MAKHVFSRNDIGDLAERMEGRANSLLYTDRPELVRDMRSAAAVLRWMLSQGIPPTPIEIDVANNGRLG